MDTNSSYITESGCRDGRRYEIDSSPVNFTILAQLVILYVVA